MQKMLAQVKLNSFTTNTAMEQKNYIAKALHNSRYIFITLRSEVLAVSLYTLVTFFITVQSTT